MFEYSCCEFVFEYLQRNQCLYLSWHMKRKRKTLTNRKTIENILCIRFDREKVEFLIDFEFRYFKARIHHIHMKATRWNRIFHSIEINFAFIPFQYVWILRSLSLSNLACPLACSFNGPITILYFRSNRFCFHVSIVSFH